MLTYYYDPNFTQKVPVDEKGALFLQYSPMILGETQEQVLYVRNEYDDIAELAPFSSDDRFSIIDYPRVLKPGQGGPVRIRINMVAEVKKAIRARWGLKPTLG